MKNTRSIRILRIIVCSVAAVVLTSCNDWLSVNPKTESESDKFFKNEQGYKDALIGAYIQMKNNSIYGQSLTMTTIEHLASLYDNPNNTSTVTLLNRHMYDDATVEASFRSMYGQLYKVISSVNFILSYIDDYKGVFVNENTYRMIKGECLGIRAMCHFDLIRLFGPVPLNVNNTSKYLPYVKTVDKNLKFPITFEAYNQEIINDLENAKELLSADPLIDNSTSSDKFFTNRTSRINFYAVRALQARVNLYIGNKTEAYSAAKDVVDSKKFRLSELSDLNIGDLSMSSEHILYLNDFRLPDKFKNLYQKMVLCKGSDYTAIQSQLYGNTGVDIREPNVSRMWSLVTIEDRNPSVISMKYSVSGMNRIPLIRLSEMYLILAETAPLAEAQTYWDSYRTSRRIATTTLTTDNIRQSIIPEYRKEFYSEGLIFFNHKRLNSPKSEMLWSKAITINYVLPMPKDEIK